MSSILLEQIQLWLFGLFERTASPLAFHDKLLSRLMLPLRIAFLTRVLAFTLIGSFSRLRDSTALEEKTSKRLVDSTDFR